MKKTAYIVICALLLGTGLGTAQTPQPGKQTEQTLTTNLPVTLDYLLYLPEKYDTDSTQTWPLILFLHGAGERGNDLIKVKKHGPPALVETMPILQQFIILSPQCPSRDWWNSASLKVLLDDISARYAVDPQRIYVTGLSMGGYGTWDVAATYPTYFAAIAPICGGGIPYRVRALAHHNVPAWVFHGLKDTAVDPDESQRLVDVLRNAGGQVTYTAYPEAGHDAWTETYRNPALYEWFLAQQREAYP